MLVNDTTSTGWRHSFYKQGEDIGKMDQRKLYTYTIWNCSPHHREGFFFPKKATAAQERQIQKIGAEMKARWLEVLQLFSCESKDNPHPPAPEE